MEPACLKVSVHDIESVVTVTDIDSRKTACCVCAFCIVAMLRRTILNPTATPLKKQKDESGGASRSSKIYSHCGAGPTVFYIPVVEEAWLTIGWD